MTSCENDPEASAAAVAFSKEGVGPWEQWGATSEEIGSWSAAGVGWFEALSLTALGLSPGDAKGLPDSGMARHSLDGWVDAGVPVGEIAAWIATILPLGYDDAAAWRNEGWSPQTAGWYPAVFAAPAELCWWQKRIDVPAATSEDTPLLRATNLRVHEAWAGLGAADPGAKHDSWNLGTRIARRHGLIDPERAATWAEMATEGSADGAPIVRVTPAAAAAFDASGVPLDWVQDLTAGGAFDRHALTPGDVPWFAGCWQRGVSAREALNRQVLTGYVEDMRHTPDETWRWAARPQLQVWAEGLSVDATTSAFTVAEYWSGHGATVDVANEWDPTNFGLVGWSNTDWWRHVALTLWRRGRDSDLLADLMTEQSTPSAASST